MQGWILKDGLWLNQYVAADSEATLRGGSLAFNPNTFGFQSIPWSDGSGDVLNVTPELPPGTIIGTPKDVAWGVEYPCTGPLSKITIVDLQNTKWSIHAACPYPGAKVIWFMSVARIVDSGGGVWRAKRTTLSGCQFTVAIQPRTLTDIDGGTRDQFGAGSAAIFGATGKHHNLLHPDGQPWKMYGPGKIGHFIAPIGAGWKANGRLAGVIYGWYEWDAINSQLVKCFDYAQCMALVAAGAVEISIDDTHGYTSVGATTILNDNRAIRLGKIPSSGTVTSLSAYMVANVTWLQLYEESNPDDTNHAPDNPIANGGASGTSTGAANWYTQNVNNASVSANQMLWIACLRTSTSGTQTNYYDVGTSTVLGQRGGATASYPVGSPPNPYVTGGAFGDDPTSGYLTYTAGGGGGNPQCRRFGRSIHGVKGIRIH